MGRNLKVILQPVKFRKKNHVAVLCPNNSEVDAVIREMENAEWSTGYRFWHLPITKSKIKEITVNLKGIATVDASAFKDFEYEEIVEVKEKRRKIKAGKPSDEQKEKLANFIKAYAEKGYSEGTLKVYLSMLNVFFGWFNNKKDSEINSNDIQDFLTEYIDKNNLTTNYKRLMSNSLRRYFDFSGRTDLERF